MTTSISAALTLVASLCLATIFATGCAHRPCSKNESLFSLKSTVRTQSSGEHVISFELKNEADSTQLIYTLTNVFSGDVFLRSANGLVTRYIQSNYLIMQLTGFYMEPGIVLGPQASFRWEHKMQDYVDQNHPMPHPNDADAYPILLDEWKGGAALWSSLKIFKSQQLDETHSTFRIVGAAKSDETYHDTPLLRAKTNRCSSMAHVEEAPLLLELELKGQILAEIAVFDHDQNSVRVRLTARSGLVKKSTVHFAGGLPAMLQKILEYGFKTAWALRTELPVYENVLRLSFEGHVITLRGNSSQLLHELSMFPEFLNVIKTISEAQPIKYQIIHALPAS